MRYIGVILTVLLLRTGKTRVHKKSRVSLMSVTILSLERKSTIL